MATKGSRKNPYTVSEFNTCVNANTWHGGWVKEDDLVYYCSQSMATYVGWCTKSNPVPQIYYEEMEQNHIWLGGWVMTILNGKKYYDVYGTEYDSTLGYQSNPVPMTLYNEMVSNGSWEGGWIEESDGTIRYVEVFQISLSSGSGCGCGSGNGCGCGSGGSGSGGNNGCGCGSGEGSIPENWANSYPVSAGSCKAGVFYIDNGNEAGNLYAEWTAGNTVGPDGLSVVTITPRLDGAGIYENHIRTEWQNAYLLSISGYFTLSTNPNRYYFISGLLSIPGEFCLRD